MSTYKPDCRKFQANIFNKSKCTNCFRQREEHSTDALDSNRASRSVSKCGYLFVAPDWDFTIPLYRTKRWQRRWFVLYDDGELTYSVDDLPATIPQGVIDMNRVLEVSSAEDVTGNQFSLAITSPDRVTFVKGTTREESRWWQDVLSVFPRMHKHGRHKRNATFPGIKGSSGAASASAAHQSVRPGASNRAPNTMESPVNQRVRFHSISSDLRGTRRPCSAPSLDTQQFAHQKPFSGGSRSSHQYDSVTESSNGSDISNEDDDGLTQTRRGEDSGAYSDEIEKNNQKNSYYSSKNRPISQTPTSFTDIARTEYGGSNMSASGSTVTPFNSLLYSRSNPIPTPSQTPSSRAGLPSSTSGSTGLLASTPSRLLRDDHKENTPPYAPDYDDNPPTSESPPTQDKQTHRLRTRRALNREARALSQPRSELDTSSVLADLEATKREEKLKDIAASITTTSSRRRQYHHLHHHQGNVADKPTRDRDTDDMDSISDPTDTPPPTQARGAPDGCGGVEDGGSVSLPRVDLPAEDLLFIKKGWLFKAADNQEWNKHWFVLQGTGLRFYRNSSAEETGILDGIIDLGTAEDIHNLDVARNYGFVIKMWSEKQFVFSAVTAGIRSNWVTALRNAAGLKEAKSDLGPGKEANNPKDSLAKSATIESVAAERDSSSQSKCLLANNKKNASLLSKSSSSNLESFSTPNGLSKTSFSAGDTGGYKQHDGVKSDEVSENRSSSRVALSSDDEYKTASETSAASNLSTDNADFFDWDGSRLPNAASSPIKKPRSQSSPPNSRRGTSDSFPSSENSYGLSKNLLDRYKNMQTLTTKHSTPVPSKTNADELDSRPAVSDTRSALQGGHDTCDSKSTCAKLSSYSAGAKEAGISALKLSDSLRSLDLEGSIHHDKVSSSGTLASGSGDALLVDLLETQVETLKAKLEATQVDDLVEQVNVKDEQLEGQAAALRDLQAQHEQEKATWREAGEGGEADRCTVGQLQSSLQESEKRVAALRARLDDSDVTDGLRGDKGVSGLQLENTSLVAQLRECHEEIAALRESVKCEKSEAYKWKDLVKELRSLLDGRNIDMDRKREEIRLARESLKTAQQEHEVTRDKLQRGIEENESLNSKLRELQRQLNSQGKRTSSVPSVYASRDKLSSRRHLPRFDSLSDLSNVDFSLDPDALDRETLNDEYCNVRSRLEWSLNEIRALRRELRESQSEHDAMQLKHLQLTQDCARQRHDSDAQLAFMTERVQDLTNKLAYSEKQVRQMKTKMTRAESRDRRRTQSLRGKDALGVTKDVELKLSQLEARIDQLMPTIDTTADGPQSSMPSVDDSRLSESQRSSFSSKHGGRTTKRSKSFDDPTKSSRLRRKSLDSLAASGDGVQAAIRISSLEAKVAALTPARSASPARTGSPADSPSSSRSKVRASGERYSRSRRGADVDAKVAAEVPTDVMSSISLQLGECVEWLDTYSCSCGRSELSFLHQRLSALYQLTASGLPLPPSPYSLSQQSQKLLPTVQQVVLLLQQKLASLNERRHNLKNSNSWTKEAQLKNFAERIAYETVLLGQVSQALRICSQSNCNTESIKLQDLMESHRKMAFLEKKLTNPEFDLDTMAPLEFYTSMLAEKLVVTGEVLASVPCHESHKKSDPTLSATCRDLQVRLLERESQLARLISNYKEEKLHEIAVVMTQGNRNNATLDESVLLEEVRIREAWNTAQNLLIQEIMSHQTSQSLLRMTHMLNLTDGSPAVPSASSLSLTLCSAEATDRLQAAAEESLKQEMEESVMTLSRKYEEILAQQRAGDTSLVNSVSASIEEVLSEFAGVMAQKALIDGHLALLQEEFDKNSIPTAQNSLIISEDNKDPMESAVDVLDSEAHLLMFLGGKDSSVESLVKPALSHAEFTFLYNKGIYQINEDSKQLLQQILSKKAEVLAPASSSSFRSSSLSLHQTSPVASDKDQDGTEQPRLRAAISMSKINPSPKSRRRHENRKSRRSSDITGMTSPGCKMCEEMRQELSKLQKKQQLQNSQDNECTNCPKLLDTIERLETSQRARAEQTMPSDSNQTLAEMENRIMVLEAAYEAKITALELQYKQALASHPDCGDDTIRQKYQKEIEELRGLCEKGLGTMEISTQRIVAEIKEKHRQELSLLQAEKEQALAEETQATLAALDAMRKAHEAEVQREVAKMKEEFILKMQSGQDLGELSQRHEAEMRDIRREILSLSEKYSVKCLESADLETKIDNLTKQLNDASQSIADLESRNNKLKSQLSEKITSLKTTRKESSNRDKRGRHCVDPKSTPAKN